MGFVSLIDHMCPNMHAGLLTVPAQVVDELFSYWTLEDSEDTLEQLEDLLIVRSSAHLLVLLRTAPTARGEVPL